MVQCGRGIVWAVCLMAALALGPPIWVGAAEEEMDSDDVRVEELRRVSRLTSGNLGATCVARASYSFARVPIETEQFLPLRQRADLLARILSSLPYPPSQELVEVVVQSAARSSGLVVGMRVLLTSPPRLTSAYFSPPTSYPTSSPPSPSVITTTPKTEDLEKLPWYATTEMMMMGADAAGGAGVVGREDQTFPKFQSVSIPGTLGRWSFPYFNCSTKRWLMSYTAPLTPPSTSPSSPSSFRHTLTSRERGGLVSLDVDLTAFDINQCDLRNDSAHDRADDDAPGKSQVVSYFRGTHRCHPSSICEPRGGLGWARGGYVCRCLANHYARNLTFDGALVEVAWDEREQHQSPSYDAVFVCHPCPPQCHPCTSGTPCTATYNWPFRLALLSISTLCMAFTFVVMALVYRYRTVKVFRLASPTFLCICLIGCAIMYLEMAAIFPVLDTYSCVATKWTRHLGFCVTFSSLLMKTWRVSLTYRVTSAHKMKLTDRQLLQWVTPILLVVLVYLGAWTLSATPRTEYIHDYTGLKFKQCEYDWWDHSLAVGEVVFLMWGVKVCFSVRKAESFFDEAKYISWAVYNIAVVNIVMVMFHLLIFRNAGPDVKYLFGFLRTQLSTSTTILLIFGPKFYRIMQGTGDQYDNRARAKGVTASFSLNGLGVIDDEPADLSQENEELKEEIQKLAAQMEFMKIVHMEMNNRHLKPKPGGYFSEKNSSVLAPQSPGFKPNTTTNATATTTTTTTTPTPTTSAATVTTTAPSSTQVTTKVDAIAENSTSRRSATGDGGSERV